MGESYSKCRSETAKSLLDARTSISAISGFAERVVRMTPRVIKELEKWLPHPALAGQDRIRLIACLGFFYKMIKRFLNFQTKSIASSAGILAIAALFSRFLGLIRDRLLAGSFGAGAELDIYFASFRIPDLVYNILFAGGIVVAFLPLFSEYFAKNKEEAWKMANYILNSFAILVFLICLVLFIFTPWLVELIVPGFGHQDKSSTIVLTRLMLLSPIFFGLSSIFSSILYYFKRFLVTALAPILYNLGIIFGILFLAPKYGIFGVGAGVVLGAFSHMAIQIPSAISCGFSYKPFLNFKYPAVKNLFILAVPRIIAAACSQINFIVITIIASTLMSGSITIFNFSNNLRLLPVGLIGISFATAAFPFFSESWVNGKKRDFLNSFSLVFRRILFLTVPLSLLMFLLRAQLVRIVLGTGQFGWTETKLTAACLGVYCFGIFVQTLIPVILRVYFSFQDTKTPTIIAVLSLILNIILCLSFVQLLGSANQFKDFVENILKLQGIKGITVIGLPLAFTTAMIFQFILLLIFLYKRIGDFGIEKIIKSFLKMCLASVFMGASAYISLHILASFLDMQTFLGVFCQATIAGLIGIFVYLALAILLKFPEVKNIKPFIFRQNN